MKKFTDILNEKDKDIWQTVTIGATNMPDKVMDKFIKDLEKVMKLKKYIKWTQDLTTDSGEI